MKKMTNEELITRLSKIAKHAQWYNFNSQLSNITVLTGSAGLEMLNGLAKDSEGFIGVFENNQGESFKVRLSYDNQLDSTLLDNRTYGGYSVLSYKMFVFRDGEMVDVFNPIDFER